MSAENGQKPTVTNFLRYLCSHVLAADMRYLAIFQVRTISAQFVFGRTMCSNCIIRIRAVVRTLRAWWRLRSTLFSSGHVTVPWQRRFESLEPMMCAIAHGFRFGSVGLTSLTGKTVEIIHNTCLRRMTFTIGYGTNGSQTSDSNRPIADGYIHNVILNAIS